eukprot:10974325-Prorocentrum_lima.AAC.1
MDSNVLGHSQGIQSQIIPPCSLYYGYPSPMRNDIDAEASWSTWQSTVGWWITPIIDNPLHDDLHA